MSYIVAGATYLVLTSGDDDDGETSPSDLLKLNSTGVDAARISDLTFTPETRAQFAEFASERVPLSFPEKRFGNQLKKFFKRVGPLSRDIQGIADDALPFTRKRFEEGFLDKDFDISPFEDQAFRNLNRAAGPAFIESNFSQAPGSSGFFSGLQNQARTISTDLAALDAQVENSREIQNAQLMASTQGDLLQQMLGLPAVGHNFEVGEKAKLAAFGEQFRNRQESVRPGFIPAGANVFNSIIPALSAAESHQNFVAPPIQGSGGSGLLASGANILAGQGTQDILSSLFGGQQQQQPQSGGGDEATSQLIAALLGGVGTAVGGPAGGAIGGILGGTASGLILGT